MLHSEGIYYIRYPAGTGRGRHHRHRTCDRVPKWCPIAALEMIATRTGVRQVYIYINHEI
jgi:hypothetical protein